MSDQNYVVSYQPLDIEQNMTYEEKLVAILDRRIQQLRAKEIPLVREFNGETIMSKNQLGKEKRNLDQVSKTFQPSSR